MKTYRAPCCGTQAGKHHRLSCRNQGEVTEPPPEKWRNCGPTAEACEGQRMNEPAMVAGEIER